MNYLRYGISLALLFLALHAPLGAQWLRIYHLGVGQGDCTLIIAKDSTTMGEFRTFSVLIDGGPVRSAGKADTLWKFIKHELNTVGDSTLSYIVASHLHADHVYGIVSILNRIRDENPPWKKDLVVFDRMAFAKIWGFDADSCWDLPQGNISTTYNNLVSTDFNSNRKPCAFGLDIFSMAGFRNIKMTCVAANGMVNGVNHVVKTGNDMPKSENDLSFAFLLEFQGFRYFTGGDVGGGGIYSDLETPIANYLAGLNIPSFHFCAFKVSHHGSTHSTNDHFLTTCDPSYAVISSALGSFNGTRIPVQSTIEKIDDAGCTLLYTYKTDGQNAYSGTVTVFKDVVLDVVSPPGFYEDIDIRVTTYSRDKATLSILSGTTVTTDIMCEQEHDPQP